MNEKEEEKLDRRFNDLLKEMVDNSQYELRRTELFFKAFMDKKKK